jgi:hypothetical protein
MSKIQVRIIILVFSVVVLFILMIAFIFLQLMGYGRGKMSNMFKSKRRVNSCQAILKN